MAGIGFELKKLFARKGVFAGAYAYGYAAIICCGPMLLGMALLFCAAFIAQLAGAALETRELLNACITISLLVALTVSGAFSLLVTRYVSDMIFAKSPERVMASLLGSTCIAIAIGGVLYGIFLLFAPVSLFCRVLCLALFCESVFVWTEIAYLTAVKNYRQILTAFAASLAIAMGTGAVLTLVLHLDPLPCLLFSVVLGYGIMLLRYLWILLKLFPYSGEDPYQFLRARREYPQLAPCGFLLNIGLFAHIVMMWFSPRGEQIKGIFYHCADYDMAAVFAFLSVLITTVNYVVAVEVNFYPKYRTYYALYNGGGAITDIEPAGREMLSVLAREIRYSAMRQLFCTVLFIVFGSAVLKALPLGFSDAGLGTFRILCVGYGLYAIGNMLMLSLLYFCDNQGALICCGVFAAVSIAATLASLFMQAEYYGDGFALGAGAFALCAAVRLIKYTSALPYHLLCSEKSMLHAKGENA